MFRPAIARRNEPTVAAVVGPDVGADGKPDWTRHNESIVGYSRVPENQIRRCHDAHLPGLECADCTPGYMETVYQNVFFGAAREYANDNDGWQTVHYRNRGRHARHWKGND